MVLKFVLKKFDHKLYDSQNFQFSYVHEILITIKIKAKFQAKSIARDNITKVDLYSSVAALNVYLEELSYDQTNESPTITPSSLLGTLGKKITFKSQR